MLNSSLVIVTFLDIIIFRKLSLIYYLFKVHFEVLRGCLVCVFKQPFSVFKQHFTHFNTFFHPHVFSQMFLNNKFQFLNIHTKRALSDSKSMLESLLAHHRACWPKWYPVSLVTFNSLVRAPA